MQDLLKEFGSVEWIDILSLTEEHILMCVTALRNGVIAGTVLGVLLSGIRSSGKVLQGLDRVVMIFPALALAGLAFSICSSAEYALVAFLTVYALIPVMRGSWLGARAADEATVESCRAMGMKFGDLMFHVRIPAFLPSFVKGLRRAMYQIIGGAALCAIILPLGLGVELLDMKNSDVETVFAVSVLLAALALVMDMIFGVFLLLLKKKRIG